MSLLDNVMEPFVYMLKQSTKDANGGYKPKWTEGAGLLAAAVKDSSTPARVGAVQGLTSLYTITTRRAVNLKNHTVIKRLSDGKVFRVTSDGDDKATPKSATLDMRVVTAEEYTLPE